jgi:hypothetical protein
MLFFTIGCALCCKNHEKLAAGLGKLDAWRLPDPGAALKIPLDIFIQAKGRAFGDFRHNLALQINSHFR